MRLAYFVSHPIQYQAPLLRRIAQESDIDLTVFFFSDLSVRGYADEGFGGVHVKWDIPLLEGYKHEFLPGFRKDGGLGFARPMSYGIYSRLSRRKFDVVWVHGYHTLNALHVMAVAKLLGIPAFLRSDSTLDDRARGRLKLAVKRLFFAVLRHMVFGVLTVGGKNSAYWRSAFGDDIPIFLMPYAVDNSYFRNRSAEAAGSRESLRQSLDLGLDIPVILFASKLLQRKRCMDLVEAFLRLAPASCGEPPAYLLIAGDGEDRSAIEARIQQSESTRIRFLGFQNQSELPRLFDLCDVFVLPSVHEPWGLIVNEVMNAGRAVVVSDQVGCAPDLVRDGENGFIYPARDIEALTTALKKFIDDPSLACRMGRKARETIAGFSFQQDIDGLRKALSFAVRGITP